MAEGCGGSNNELAKALGIAGTLVFISQLIKRLFKVPSGVTPIDKNSILIGAQFREGLSAIDIASKIIERKKEIGISTLALDSGAANIDLKMEVIRVEEITNAILTKMRIEGAIAPGTPITATGGNAGGPIVVQGLTTNSTKVVGIAR